MRALPGPRWGGLRSGPLHRCGVGRLLVLVALIGYPGGSRAEPPPQSASYRLTHATTNGAGEPSDSSSFSLDASLGQESAVGVSSSRYHVLQSGFWSFLGSALVPVILTASRNPSNPDDVDLAWSGNNSPYDIYASTACANIFDHYLAQEVGNTYTDSPGPADLTCYSVLATAPGPLNRPDPSPGQVVPPTDPTGVLAP